MPGQPPLLACRGLTKTFGPVTACDAVDLDVHAGRIQALLGENGAGKSTLMSLLSGRFRPDAGRILLRGRPVRLHSPAQALRRGIGMVHQRFMLVESLTVAENLALALGRAPDPAWAGELAARFGLELDPRRRVAGLSMGQRQRLEILKLLARQAEVLILDEPTSVLAPPEIAALMATLRDLARNGRAVILITHKLAEVAGVADEVSVLRRGRLVLGNLPAAGQDPAALARLMTGDSLPPAARRRPAEPGEPVLRAEGLRGRDERGRPAFADVALSVRRGEILALAGVAGNGQEALGAALGGLAPLDGGDLEFLGRACDARHWPPDRRRLAYLPEDRHGTASVPDMDLAGNWLLSSGGGPSLLVDRRAAARAVEQTLGRYRIKAEGPGAPARSLSGGNLQKFLLARELAKAAPLLVVEQPTQGLDARAVEEVREQLLAASANAAVILVSADPDEILGLADRILVLYRGRPAGIVDPRAPGALERLGLLMAGLEAA